MAARKKFIVIAYDISDNKRRKKVVNAVQKFGGRVNLSVFECMVTDSQFKELCSEIKSIINTKKDCVIYYTLCTDCFSKIVYCPDVKHIAESSTTII